MAESLPMLYAVFDDEDSLDGMFANRADADVSAEEFQHLRLVEYIPRPVVCRECRFYQEFQTGFDCTHCCGLKCVKQDGSSSCSYAEPKEAREDG